MRLAVQLAALASIVFAAPVLAEPATAGRSAVQSQKALTPTSSGAVAVPSEETERIPAHTPEWTNPKPGDPGRYEVDPRAGSIRFGDGTTGRRPPAGRDGVLGTYRKGGGAAPLEKHQAEPVRGGLRKLPENFSVQVERPAHPGAPARVTARKTGESIGYAGELLMRISLTCDGNKVVQITPSVYEVPRTLFAPFDPVSQKVVSVMPEGRDVWEHPDGCFYSITARMDPNGHVAEPNEHDNADTAQYAAHD